MQKRFEPGTRQFGRGIFANQAPVCASFHWDSHKVNIYKVSQILTLIGNGEHKSKNDKTEHAVVSTDSENLLSGHN